MNTKISYIINNLHLYRKKDIPRLWHKIFSYYLKDDMYIDSINDMFSKCTVSNWKDLHLENSIYSDYNKNELLNEFIRENRYCIDRMTWDRLLRIHWLFHRWIELEFKFYGIKKMIMGILLIYFYILIYIFSFK